VSQDPEKIASLATCLASGGSIPQWAKAQGVPRRTAYRWASDGQVKAQVQTLRQGLIGDAVGQLAAAAATAVETLQGLLAATQPPGIRLGRVPPRLLLKYPLRTALPVLTF
jgi:hypothetical protein